MLATTFPYRFALREFWAMWLEDHPEAAPPANLVIFLRAPVGHAAMVAAMARQKLGLTQVGDEEL